MLLQYLSTEGITQCSTPFYYICSEHIFITRGAVHIHVFPYITYIKTHTGVKIIQFMFLIHINIQFMFSFNVMIKEHIIFLRRLYFTTPGIKFL